MKVSSIRQRVGSSILAALLTLFSLLALTAAACTTSEPQRPVERDTFIGRPPPPESDDPFFARALPAEAVPAEASGRIGGTTRPTIEAPVEAPVEVPVEVPDEEVETPPHTQFEPRSACFSCVRICPVSSDGQTRCSDDADDLICGWGSHPDREEARITAEAHCDATLDMARQMQTYSEISGQCPVATCR